MGMRFTQVAESTPFDTTNNGFSSQNVQNAIEEVLDRSTNFSYNNVVLGKTITVPEHQQMRVYQELSVRGELKIYGEVIIKDV
jgi:hypothetical protein